MAKAAAINALSPWEDRWNTPDEAGLIAHYKDQQERVCGLLCDGLKNFEGMQRVMAFQGQGWNWSWRYWIPGLYDATRNPKNKKPVDEPLAYLIPEPEGIKIVIPITDEFIESLPFRRLNRYIRDQIKSAGTRQAVDYLWATFTPTAGVEIEHLMDLMKRKIKYLASTAS